MVDIYHPIGHVEGLDKKGYIVRNPKRLRLMVEEAMDDCGYISFAERGSYLKRENVPDLFRPAITYDEISRFRDPVDFLEDNFGEKKPEMYKRPIVTWTEIAHSIDLEKFLELSFANGLLVDEEDESEE